MMGCARFVYNRSLSRKIEAFQKDKIKLSVFDLMKEIAQLKKQEEFSWLKECQAQVLQASIRNIDSAFTGFFKGTSKFPKFKKKSRNGSIQFPQNVEIENDKIYLPKIGWVKFFNSRSVKGTIKTVTVKSTPTCKFFVSVLCETGELIPEKKSVSKETTVGLDLGIKSFCVTSDNQVFENQRYLIKSLKKLRVEQRSFSRKVKGSRRQEKQRIRVAKIHEKIANQRKHYLHEISTYLVKQYDTICIEDLAISNMIKNNNLAKYIQDQSWSTFRQMLTYKCEWHGKNLNVIGKFEPSSKLCNSCGTINKELTLADRIWKCSKCNVEHDRDLNAAKNIKDFGLEYRPSIDKTTH